MKYIKGYENLYSITNDGKVFSHISNKWLKLDRRRQKKLHYSQIKLRSKTFRVHRLVAQAYIPNPLNLPEIDHINNNGEDNRVENLRWCTTIQNQQNRRRQKGGSSKYRGVYRNWYNNMWIVEGAVNKKRIKIGVSRDEVEAAKMYNEFALKNFGDFAKLNEF